jgi:hypothetical protein
MFVSPDNIRPEIHRNSTTASCRHCMPSIPLEPPELDSCCPTSYHRVTASSALCATQGCQGQLSPRRRSAHAVLVAVPAVPTCCLDAILLPESFVLEDGWTNDDRVSSWASWDLLATPCNVMLLRKAFQEQCFNNVSHANLPGEVSGTQPPKTLSGCHWMPTKSKSSQHVATSWIRNPASFLWHFYQTWFNRQCARNPRLEAKGQCLLQHVANSPSIHFNVCAFTLQVLRSYSTLPCAPVLLQIPDVHPRLGSSKCVSKAAYVTWTNSIQYTHLYKMIDTPSTICSYILQYIYA